MDVNGKKEREEVEMRKGGLGDGPWWLVELGLIRYKGPGQYYLPHIIWIFVSTVDKQNNIIILIFINYTKISF